jgi:hypothetical protein
VICAYEFAMAHEAFALSPISARAAQPSEADYEAIREAFVETARGRWFLGEYAKRNRRADTHMVLDAVARIERTLEALQRPPPDTRLPAIIWNIVDQAEEAAASAVDGLAIEERLAPIRKGARILKEISWRWREIGTESRICDSIDSQVDAIQESCSKLAGMDIRAALTGEFELIRTRIEALAEDDGNAVPQTADAVTKPDSAASAVQVAREDDALASALMAAPDAAVSSQETCVTAVLDVAMTQSERAETANVQDGALLGIVAIELATLAGTNGHSWGDAADRDRIEPTRSEPMVVAEPVELAPTQAGGYVVSPWMQAEPAVASLLQSHPPLGSTPLTNKFLEQRRPPDTDPFSAIRRMSLPEKIEFFS